MPAEPSTPPARGHLDLPKGRLSVAPPFPVAGWAGGEGPRAGRRVMRDGVAVGTAEVGIARPDVGRLFPAYPHAGHSGFLLNQVPAPATPAEAVTLTLEFRFGGG